MMYGEVFLRPFSLTKSRSQIKEVSLLDRFPAGDTMRAHFNLVGGGFHSVL